MRARLLAGAPLTVDQLNWPGEGQLEGAKAEDYEAYAHLFVRGLIRLRGGAACLRNMLALLPQHLNWQTAFFQAFQPHFQRMLEVEKWWSLMLVNLTGRDPTQVWPLPESCQRLDEVLLTVAQVRLGNEEIPHQSQVSLQAVLKGWDFGQQVPLLRRKMAQLAEVRRHLAPEIAKLANDYRVVLEEYLRAREQDEAASSTRRRLAPRTRVIINDAIGHLEKLDARREELGNLDPPTDSPKGSLRSSEKPGQKKTRKPK